MVDGAGQEGLVVLAVGRAKRVRDGDYLAMTEERHAVLQRHALAQIEDVCELARSRGGWVSGYSSLGVAAARGLAL